MAISFKIAVTIATLFIVLTFAGCVEGWRKKNTVRPRSQSVQARALMGRHGGGWGGGGGGWGGGGGGWGESRPPKPAPRPGGKPIKVNVGAIVGVIGAGIKLGVSIAKVGLIAVGGIAKIIGGIFGGCKLCSGGGGSIGGGGGGGSSGGNGNPICPLNICAVCPGGACTSITLPHPVCVFTEVIAWNAAQLTLPIYCQYFNPNHQCCQGGGGETSVEKAKIICLFGICVKGPIRFSILLCRILFAPSFGSLELTIPILCKFLEPTHRCCSNCPQLSIDSQCPFGICPHGQVQIEWPSCVLQGEATWNGIPVNLPLICLIFLPGHMCCKNPEGISGGGGDNGGGTGGGGGGECERVDHNGKICLFLKCADSPPGGVQIDSNCVIKNPPKIGVLRLTIPLICKHLNKKHRCCGGVC